MIVTTALGDVDVLFFPAFRRRGMIAAWVPDNPGKVLTVAGVAVECRGFALAQGPTWTHTRENGRDGIIAPAASVEERQAIDAAVTQGLEARAALAARIFRLARMDDALDNGARLDFKAAEQRQAAQDFEGNGN